jgi:hypothetical protein
MTGHNTQPVVKRAGPDGEAFDKPDGEAFDHAPVAEPQFVPVALPEMPEELPTKEEIDDYYSPLHSGNWDRAARFLVEEICQGDPDRAKRLFNALRQKLEPKKKSAE